jgi:16S rRNA G966 N2-methylase RsmD
MCEFIENKKCKDKEEDKEEDIPDNSIDLIFTDPPYDKESLYIYDALHKLAARVLKPGGNLVVYSGHHFLPQIFNCMNIENSGLRYIWQFIIDQTGAHSTMHLYRLEVHYKPLLWFVKGNIPTNTDTANSVIKDLIKSTPPDKSFHNWAQSSTEAEYIISKLSFENQIVLDPFMGSGTTGITAIKLNRKFIGIEIDEDTFNIAKGRIAEFRKEKESKK